MEKRKKRKPAINYRHNYSILLKINVRVGVDGTKYGKLWGQLYRRSPHSKCFKLYLPRPVDDVFATVSSTSIMAAMVTSDVRRRRINTTANRQNDWPLADWSPWQPTTASGHLQPWPTDNSITRLCRSAFQTTAANKVNRSRFYIDSFVSLFVCLSYL